MKKIILILLFINAELLCYSYASIDGPSYRGGIDGPSYRGGIDGPSYRGGSYGDPSTATFCYIGISPNNSILTCPKAQYCYVGGGDKNTINCPNATECRSDSMSNNATINCPKANCKISGNNSITNCSTTTKESLFRRFK